ncbi:hypothetical protein FRC20_011542 [Serendipita sp. 405]|nr:hypothetical protein FRC20_011542 [Serendipita sp. 405]
MLAPEHNNDHQNSPSNSLPSIRELFGIKTTDKLDTLTSSHHRPPRSAGPPPSAYSRQAALPSPGTPLEPQSGRGPIRSNSFSSGQKFADSYLATQSTRVRRPSPSPRSATPYPTTSQLSSSRPAVSHQSSQSPSGTAFVQALPPISTAIPDFIPANRGRAVSDTEAHSRVGYSGRSSSHPHQSFLASPAPLHPSLQPRLRADSVDDQQGHIGRSGTHVPVDDVHQSPSGRSQAHSIAQSSGFSDDASQPWSRRSFGGTSRSSVEYPASSSSHEYAPHPFSVTARRASGGSQYPPLPHVSSTSTVPGPYSSEGSAHASPSRATDRAPPSAFPHGAYPSSANRPRSANSSEGDETKSGYGKYECEYCSKRFNRPSSLRIHINTHTGAKPFQCPFPNCGRRFSVMSNMRRHARTHGNMMMIQPGDEEQAGQNAGGHHNHHHHSHHPHHPHHPAVSNPNSDLGHHGVEGDSERPFHMGSSSRRSRRKSNGRQWSESGAEVDELEDEEDDEMDTDAGGGTSESDGYPARKSLRSVGYGGGGGADGFVPSPSAQ